PRPRPPSSTTASTPAHSHRRAPRSGRAGGRRSGVRPRGRWGVFSGGAGGGAGGEQEAWAARAKAAGLTGLRMLGFRTDIASLLAAADVLVHPARYEAYGLGVHEAICRGVPAIVCAAAGVAERFPADLSPLLLPAGAGAGEVAA